MEMERFVLDTIDCAKTIGGTESAAGSNGGPESAEYTVSKPLRDVNDIFVERF